MTSGTSGRTRTADGDLQGPVEPGRVDRGAGRRLRAAARGEPRQQGDIAVDVEGVGSALAVASPEADEFGVVEVEAVHADDDRLIAEGRGQRVTDGRLPRAGSADDAENASRP
jgi:hypothetical protein